MRFLGPLPPTRVRSTPSSRANLRTDGDACAPAPDGSGAGVGAAATAGAWAAAAAGAARADGAAAGAGAAGAAAAVSSTNTCVPLSTLSPTLTLTSLTTPAWLDGISMLALSDSTVSSD